MLRFYDEDIKFLKSKCNEDIIFQQDGASNHTSKLTMKFIDDNFYINELNEEEKKIKEVKKPKAPKKAKVMSKKDYEELKRQYDENLFKHKMKLEEIEEKRLSNTFNKTQNLMLDWPSNSPVKISFK